MLLVEVKTSIRDEDSRDIFDNMQKKAETMKKNITKVVNSANLPKEYENTDRILPILVANKINESIKKAGEKRGITVYGIQDMPSGGVAYLVDGGEW